jgi:hypothetical protein
LTVERWSIERTRAIAPPSGAAFDAAYLVKLLRGEASRDVAVEFQAPSAVASNGYAEEVTRPFLGDEEPPQGLVVECGGRVRVCTGPLAVIAGAPRPAATRQPQRARAHGRRGA